MKSDAANTTSAQGLELCAELQNFCERSEFKPGELLRQKGDHCRDMLYLTSGEVAVELDPKNALIAPINVKPGQPIGEIGFLHGTPANATVTAKGPVSALVLDDEILARIEKDDVELAARLMRSLAQTAEDRSSLNLTLASEVGLEDAPNDIEIRLCRDAEMLTQAQQLRYEVYCVELGRDSPSACHSKGTIADELDQFGHSFIALQDGEVVGTMRSNYAREGSLGILEKLYGMSNSPHHPHASGICTKFIVKSSHRNGLAAMKLIAGQVQFGLRHGMNECYIDCIPTLFDYYKALGFEVAGEEFFHRENGPSVPMRLDLIKSGDMLAGEEGIWRMLRLYIKAMKEARRAKGAGAGDTP